MSETEGAPRAASPESTNIAAVAEHYRSADVMTCAVFFFAALIFGAGPFFAGTPVVLIAGLAGLKFARRPVARAAAASALFGGIVVPILIISWGFAVDAVWLVVDRLARLVVSR